MKTVLHVAEAFGGGIFYFIAQISMALADDFNFVVLYGTRAETPENFADFFPKGTRFLQWKSVEREVRAVGELAALSEINRAIADIKPDVVHAHSSKAGALARLSAIGTGTPVLYSPNGYASVRCDISPVKRAAFRAAEYLLGRLPHITVACGESEFRDALFLARRAQMICNTVPLHDVRHPRQQSEEPLLVVMSGRITAQKNFPLFREIARRATGENIRFIWIGGGGDPGDVPSNLEVTGWISRADAMAFVVQADVYLQTALWEGLPLAVLEAMSLGKPILATGIGPNRELVVQGENGYICNAVDDFVLHLKAFSRDRHLAYQMGCKSRHYVQCGYDMQVAMGKWRSIYNHYDSYYSKREYSLS